MLAARRLPEVLQTALHTGVEGVCLMTSDGSILSAVFTEDAQINDTALAAVSSSIWNNYSSGLSDISFQLLKLENGRLGITNAGRGYILAAYGGKDVSSGLLRGRLESLSAYFNRVFEKLK